MRHRIFLFTIELAVLLLVGCGSVRDQVIETVLEGAPEQRLLIHQGDSIQITYWLWDENGVMSFAVHNPTDRPIYIDWYKSALIYNGQRLPYWSESRHTTVEGITQRSDLTILKVNDYLGRITASTTGRSVFAGAMVETKPERISFIPPRSSLFRNTRWNLLTSTIKNGQNWTNTEVPASYDNRRKEEVKVREYTQDQSPLVFRNFMTWSFTERFDQEFYVDDAFWVKRVSSMRNREFRGKRLSGDGPPYPYQFPYAAGDRFFVEFLSE